MHSSTAPKMKPAAFGPSSPLAADALCEAVGEQHGDQAAEQGMELPVRAVGFTLSPHLMSSKCEPTAIAGAEWQYVPVLPPDESEHVAWFVAGIAVGYADESPLQPGGCSCSGCSRWCNM